MNMRNMAIWGVIVVVLIGLYSMMSGGGQAANSREITYSQLLAQIDSGQVASAVIRGAAVEVRNAEGEAFTAVTPNNQEELVKRLEAQNADIAVKPAGGFTLVVKENPCNRIHIFF